MIKFSLKFDVSFCKLMLGVVGFSATVIAVHYFAKEKNKVSKSNTKQDSVRCSSIFDNEDNRNLEINSQNNLFSGEIVSEPSLAIASKSEKK